jgi:uncharacterized membrane protein YidH (DUF202 family)
MGELFILNQLNTGNLIEQIKIYLSNPSEFREQIAILALAAVAAVIVLVTFYFGFISFLERRRVKKAIKRRVRRKRTPFEIAVRKGLLIISLIAIFSAYYYTHYNEKFCSTCHYVEPFFREHQKAADHKNVTCISCHSAPGLTGKAAHIPVEIRNLFVHMNILKPLKNPVIYDSSCYSCHKEITSKVVGNITRVRHADFIFASKGSISCYNCHKGAGHTREEVRSKQFCANCHNGKDTFAMKECTECHREDVTISRSAIEEPIVQKIPAGQIRCNDVCHPKEVDAKCTPCHGTVMPHPEEFVRRHAANSWANRALCVRCHQERGATTKRACGCHPEEGDTMHGTYEWWFIEHQKAARSNPYMNCLCHSSTFKNDLCDFCHVEGSPLRKAMIEQMQSEQGSFGSPVSPGP